MKKFLTFMVVTLALFGAQPGSAQTADFNPEILSAKARVAYSKLAKTCVFRVGGVGYGAQTSNEELALYDLLEDARALEALHSLVKTGSYEGGLYGLVGLSIRDHGEFNLAVEIYKARKEQPVRPENGPIECLTLSSVETVTTQSGCIIGVEPRDKVVTAIQSGHYDRRLNAKYRPRK